MQDAANITIIRRETRLEQLRARWGTVGQAKFVLRTVRRRSANEASQSVSQSRSKRSTDNAATTRVVKAAKSGEGQAEFDDYQTEDDAYRAALERLQRELDFGLPIKVLDREFTPNYDFSRTALVVVLGQDGLVANTAKYVGALPVLGVNPDPSRFDGVLLPFVPEHIRPIAGAVLGGKYPARRVTLAETRLNDGQKLLAFNDLFLGAASHISARHLLNAAGTPEAQSSSGLIVSTGAGSTGWMSSVFNMVNGIVRSFGDGTKRGGPWPWEARRLMWAVREPFVSKTSRADSIVGAIDDARPKLIVESLMPQSGVIFSDGVEKDFLEFNSGAIAEIGIAGHQANLVVAG
ncbi:MAG: hypothetical protein QM811_18610 [Pirellulales bacterium]